jgi:hypothetical protein
MYPNILQIPRNAKWRGVVRTMASPLVVGVFTVPVNVGVSSTTASARETIPLADGRALNVWDSGWVAFPSTPPLTVALAHNLGGDPGAYVVSLKFRGFEGTGVHNNAIGGLYDVAEAEWQGGYFSELDAETVDVTRYEGDLPVTKSPHAEFRLIIWSFDLVLETPELTAVIRPVLDQNRPNPFVTATRIHFSLAKRSQAKLAIYDVMGRSITTLFDGEIAPGSHEFVWDGRDSHDRAVANGTYFYELCANGSQATRKAIVLR